jgi:threonine dehydratase
VIAGAATIGKEIEEWILAKKKSVDYLFVSVGGGGLISGISFYLKYMKKYNTRIIGV